MPALPTTVKARSIVSLSIVPMVTSALSAPTPQVSSWTMPVRLVGVGDGVRGAQLQRLLALERDRVDGHDVLGAREPRALHGVDADAADAVDDHALPGPDVGGVGGRAPAGRHAAADERGDVERQVGLDPHRRVLVDHARTG